MKLLHFQALSTKPPYSSLPLMPRRIPSIIQLYMIILNHGIMYNCDNVYHKRDSNNQRIYDIDHE